MTTNITATEVTFPSISLHGERWRPVKGHSSNYFVSDMGRVLTTSQYGVKGRTAVMKPGLDPSGYWRTVMDGKTVKVHRLVAEAWIPNPLNRPMVNHLDNDPKNNKMENLEWATAKENHLHSIRQGRQPHQDGEKCWKHKLKADEVRFILSAANEHQDLKILPLARLIHHCIPQVTVETIRGILKGKSWKSAR